MARTLASIGFAFVLCQFVWAADGKSDANKEAMQKLQDFIGQWNGNGGPDGKVVSKDIWSEKLSWGWRFKGDDAWFALEVKNGKHIKGGELRWVADKKQYQFSAIDIKDKQLVFQGALKKDILTLERIDPNTKETQQIQMNNAAEGIRFIYRYAKKDQGKTIYKKEYMVAANKEGMSLGGKEKKTECVVSGGLGTSPVSFKGETFYVCCSGCRDAFNENPEKYVKEFKAKKR